ncbi:aspartate/glutamate racemase family protein [Streptomyces sp. NPDC056486]|uniref:aspartate/glutamate racemase family protein n=1 Tax=Streptomyces sp. NPDC056486 TaxID=3345835 RepID=UPI003676AB1C
MAWHSSAEPARPPAVTRWKPIGVIGGLGPLACARFYSRLVELTDADSDDAHPEVILLSSPAVPSRLDHLLRGGPSPVPALRKVARRLQAAGAELIALPSLTSQTYRYEIATAVDIPVVDMLTALSSRLHAAGVRRPALAVTDGTRRVGHLHRALTAEGLDPVLPGPGDQERIQGCVDLVKSGQVVAARELFRSVVGASWASSAGDAFVIGCTDLSDLSPLAEELPPHTHDIGAIYARAVLSDARPSR